MTQNMRLTCQRHLSLYEDLVPEARVVRTDQA